MLQDHTIVQSEGFGSFCCQILLAFTFNFTQKLPLCYFNLVVIISDLAGGQGDGEGAAVALSWGRLEPRLLAWEACALPLPHAGDHRFKDLKSFMNDRFQLFTQVYSKLKDHLLHCVTSVDVHVDLNPMFLV